MKLRMHNPKIKDKVQKPGKLTSFITNLIIIIDVLMVLLLIIGLMGKELDLILISAGLVVLFTGIIIFLKHAYDTSYKETEEYLILKNGKKEQKVFYEDIVDWKPDFNEIRILDGSKKDGKFTRVNVKLFKPEILLRTIADMTFDGKFYSTDKKYSQDPSREMQIVHYLINIRYDYLIKDYIKEKEDILEKEENKIEF